MAVAFDNTHAALFSTGNVANLTSASWANAGNFMAGFAASGAGGPVVALAPKWGGSGGTAFTPQHAGLTVSSFGRFRVFTLVSPTVQSSTSYYDWGTNQDETTGGTLSFTGVDTSTPIGAVASATGNNLAPALNVASAVGDMVVYGIFFLDGGGANRTFGGITGDQRYVVQGTNLGFEGMLLATVVATLTTTPVAATISGANPTDVNWGIFGFAIKAGAAAASDLPYMPHYQRAPILAQ